MATTYTPDPTATQAPASTPDPDDFPLETLPSSGDGATAASIAQAFKVCGDFIAWLKKPRAVVGSFAQAIRRYKDAQLRDRFIVDHWGVPGGEFFEWRERFGDRTPWQFLAGASGTVTGTANKWAVNQTGTGLIKVLAPGIAAGLNFSDTHPTLLFDIDDTAVRTQEVILDEGVDQHTAIWSPNMLCSLDYNLQPHLVPDVTWVHGICGSGEHSNTIANGAFFISVNGGNWHARAIAGGVATDVDTGVAGTTDVTRHFKIVPVGSAIDDSGTTRVLFFIDGAQKANITTHIAATGVHMLPIWGGFSGGGSAGTQRMMVSPPRWAQITRQSTP